jgi:nitrate reductase alpha subunit
VVISPDYSEAAKFGDMWLSPRAGTDAALSMAMGHVILKEFHIERPAAYFQDYCRKYSDMPFLVRLERRGDRYVPGRMVRASDFTGALGQTNNLEWKCVAFAEGVDAPVVPQGSIGFRWGEQGKWNIESKNAADGADVTLLLSLAGSGNAHPVPVAFPYFGGQKHERFPANPHNDVLSAAATSPSPTTRTFPTRRPGRNRSAACRGTASSLSPASSRAMPKRPRAAR